MKWLLAGLLAIIATADCTSEAWNRDETLNSISFQKSENTCVPGTTFPHYCNTCKCSSHGKSKACTLMLCDLSTWNEDGTRKFETSDRSKIEQPEQICEPQSTFKDYCNTCTCSEDGRYVKCTMRVCDARIWNKDGTPRLGQTSMTELEQACQPNSMFMDYCNMCKCTPDGNTASCTRKICEYKHLNKDGTRNNSENPPEDSDRIVFES